MVSQRNAFADDILQERRVAPDRMIQDAACDHSWGDIEAEFEVDVERDVDDAVLEDSAFRVGLDDDQHVQIRVRSRVATSLGTKETELEQFRSKDLALFGEAVQRALSDGRARHGCSIASRDLSCHRCDRSSFDKMMGPFRLAYLATILRAADVRASQKSAP